MIYLYSGTPGSGKSLHVAQVIYYSLARKSPVIGNFEIDRVSVKNPDCYSYVSNSELRESPRRLIDFALNYWKDGKPVKEGKLLVVIDEAQQLFNSRAWQADGRDEWLKFFCEHRKLGFDVILIAQFDRMLDRQIRSLIEYEQIHRKLSNFGWFGFLFSLIFGGGKLFVSVKVWYPMKERVGSDIFRAKKKYYRIYNTFATFDAVSTAGALAGGTPERRGDPASAPAPSRRPKVRKDCRKWV